MLTSIKIQPGVVKDNAELASEGQWTDADKVRFRFGSPQLIGGKEKATEDLFLGKCRALHAWEENAGAKLIAVGTHRKLYIFSGGQLFDITPIRATGSLTNPITTVSTSRTVTVADTAHGAINGDYVYLSAASAVGGIRIGASGTHSASPFRTVGNSNVVIVTQTAHGLANGELVTFASATATNGVLAADLNKTHRVYKLTSDEYQIQVDTAATSSGTGGGTPTYEHYHGFTITFVDANSYTIEAAIVATSSATGGGTTKYEYEINIGRENSAGWSTGGYSEGYYSLPSTETDLRARVWHLSDLGENLLANYQESVIYRWENNWSQEAAAIAASDAPQSSMSHFTTPERFLVALGSEDAATSTWNPLLVAWASQESGFSTGDWTPAATNTAGNHLLSDGNRIIKGMSGSMVNLIWTDKALYVQRYLRDTTFVFGFDLVGTACGLIGPNAAARIPSNGAVVWLSSSRQFFMWAGGAPQVIQCPVREWMLDQLAPVQEDLIYAGLNSRWNEVWWMWPDSTNECARYVAFNYVENHWTVGTYEISAWVDRGALEYPVAAFTGGGTLEFTDKGDSDNGEPFAGHVESAYADIADGDTMMRVQRIVPEIHDQVGGVDVTINSKLWPQGATSSTAVGTILSNTTYLNVRRMARQVQLRLASNSAPTSWRLGRLGMDIEATAAKR